MTLRLIGFVCFQLSRGFIFFLEWIINSHQLLLTELRDSWKSRQYFRSLWLQNFGLSATFQSFKLAVLSNFSNLSIYQFIDHLSFYFQFIKFINFSNDYIFFFWVFLISQFLKHLYIFCNFYNFSIFQTFMQRCNYMNDHASVNLAMVDVCTESHI